MAGPFVAVVASLASAWIAVKSDDGGVAEDYYKRGLSANQRLKRTPPGPERPLGATITVAGTGEVRVRMEGLTEAPKNLRLKLAHPATALRGATVVLTPGPDGDYLGVLLEQTPGRWIVTLESDAWRLPTTTVAARLSSLRLGVADSDRARPN
jgi:hypothetical protein